MKNNICLMTDSYKASHHLQFPPGASSMFNYLESRGGRYPATLFFGLQYLLKGYLSTPITRADVREADQFFKAHGEPFNYDGWMDIVERLGGKLPVRIRAVKEGVLVPIHNALMTVESTDTATFWVVGYLETLLMRLWYPITVATQSWYIKQMIRRFMEETSDDTDVALNFKLHDFGARGVSSAESAGIGGMAHLVNFMGSDTVEGVRFANHFYNAEMAAFSIPASEHSTITSWGKENEEAAYRNMLFRFGKPGALVACVSDSYDLGHAVNHLWGEKLREEVIASGATLIVRPDSGDPVGTVLDTVRGLDAKFGSSVNSRGFKVLNHVRVIQGDGINHVSIHKILSALVEHDYSATNIAFGMGGALLQQVDRDTQKFAFKCSSVTVDGEERDVFKSPVGDATKHSKRGRLDLSYVTSNYTTVRLMPGEPWTHCSAMDTVYENGEIMRQYTLEEVRANAETSAKLRRGDT